MEKAAREDERYCDHSLMKIKDVSNVANKQELKKKNLAILKRYRKVQRTIQQISMYFRTNKC